MYVWGRTLVTRLSGSVVTRERVWEERVSEGVREGEGCQNHRIIKEHV